MRHAVLVVASTIVLALTAAGQAQRPVESAPSAVPGPYRVESGPAFGSPGHVVYRPANLAAFPARDTLPVMVWGNGGCAINSTRYAGFLTTIASHGFVVLATAAPPGRTGGDATADHLRKAIDWAAAENRRGGSPLLGKIALDRVAVMGHGPVLLVNGHGRDFAMAASKATFNAIETLPTFYGARRGAGHIGTIDHPGGGEFADVASNWLRWQFKLDKRAAKMFVGKDCSLCTNPNWDTASKRLR